MNAPMNFCSICESDRLRRVFHLDGYEISRCGNCTHLFVSTGLAARDLDGAYDQDYFQASEPGRTTGYEDYLGNATDRLRGFGQRLAFIERQTGGRRGRLLDYGCAVGLFVKVARDAGWNAMGYERSEWAARYGRETFGLDIRQGDGRDGLPFDEPFDVVTLWDVLEHLEHPRRVLNHVAGLLAPGGLLALNTVNSASVGARIAGEHWRHLAPPHHLQYFSKESVRRLLEYCGFTLVTLQNQGVMMGADRYRVEVNSAIRAIEAVSTHWRVKRLATALDLLDEVEVLAVRHGSPAVT
jgi:2-polyprenyl-3-methyl-5-hydroxy-6-metoxy-1,4-benzoquinol methylase